MKAKLFFRIASVLLVLWAIGHTLGFRTVDPNWHADSLVASIQSLHFNAQGFSRTYWDFFVGFGLIVSVFLVFVAVLAWQLSGLPPEIMARMRGASWALALCFAALTVLGWVYFFPLAVSFSAVITVCFALAAWRSTKPA